MLSRKKKTHQIFGEMAFYTKYSVSVWKLSKVSHPQVENKRMIIFMSKAEFCSITVLRVVLKRALQHIFVCDLLLVILFFLTCNFLPFDEYYSSTNDLIRGLYKSNKCRFSSLCFNLENAVYAAMLKTKQKSLKRTSISFSPNFECCSTNRAEKGAY